jgi:isoquinoline 1-oxidoreductase/isoquinoline 1-oxidoreductase beta subunit
MTNLNQDRRSFIKTTISASGSLYVVFAVPGCARALSNSTSGDLKGTSDWQSLHLKVTADNRFHLTFDRAEMGQGVITGQATLFGDEADIDPMSFIMEAAPADAAGRFGMQITGGSTSTKDRGPALRKAGAAYRRTLIDVAAKAWSVPAQEILTDNGRIFHAPSKRNEPYAAFNQQMATAKLVEEPRLKEPNEFRYIGTFNQSVDARDKVTGAPEFGIDLDLPDMRVAIVLRSPVFGGTLKKFDQEKISKLPYVEDVFAITGGVAVVCGKYWQTLKVRAALTPGMIEWDIPQSLRVNSADLFKAYHESLKNDAPKGGSDDEAVISASYELPFLAHAPLEPQNTAAVFRNGTFEIWSPSQAPQLLQAYAADLAGISRDKVVVHVSKYLGGGFGRRAGMDFGVDAVEIAHKVKYPVKVMWSREDDMTHSPMRPMSVHRLDAVVNRKTKQITSWRHQIAGQSIMSPLVQAGGSLMAPGWLPKFVRRGFASAASGLMDAFDVLPMLKEGAEQAYDFKVETSMKQMESAIPVTFWRSVGNSHNGLVVEGFLDEVIHELGEDPYEFRRKLLHKNARALRVLELAGEKAGWSTPPTQPNRALGIAYHYSYKSYAAEVADVEVKDGKIIIHRFVAAVDCGQVVNPEIVRRQVRSGIIFGLTAALYGENSFVNGEMQQTNYDTYQLLQLQETPAIDVHIVPSTESSTGIGEPGYPPSLPAVANAVFRATGKRLRRTPFQLT